VAAVALLAAAPAASWAQMSVRVSAQSPYVSATLQPPTGLTGSACTAKGATTLSWTTSTSPYTAGYQLWAQPSPGSASMVGTVSADTTSVTVNGLAKKTRYTFWLVGTYRSWTSQASGVTSVQC
jgi:hypothetical protein